MGRPHPNDFTVSIEQLPGGAWRLHVSEAPEIWGEGATLPEALDSLRKRALPVVPKEQCRSDEVLIGAAAAFAAETTVERYLESQAPAVDDDDSSDQSVSWDDVSVLGRKLDKYRR
jgi:hypothetical protein